MIGDVFIFVLERDKKKLTIFEFSTQTRQLVEDVGELYTSSKSALKCTEVTKDKQYNHDMHHKTHEWPLRT